MTPVNGSEKANGWPAEVHQVFRAAGVRQVGYVPDSGLAELIRLCESDPEIAAVSLTSEEEGVALAAGAWLGGQRSALLMQSSGVGNCMNAFAMAAECGFPLLLLVTMRGEQGEFNPWQTHMGRMVAPAIELAGGIVKRVNDETSVGPAVEAAARHCVETSGIAAVTLAQELIGFKAFDGGAGDG